MNSQPDFFALSCSMRDGYYCRSGRPRQPPVAHPRPSKTGGATAGPLPSGGCDQHRFLVDCSSPASLPLVQPTSSRQRLCCLQALTTPSRASRGLSHRLLLAMLCSSKGSDGRSEAMNATLLRLDTTARLISCRVTPLPPRLCITHCRPRAIRSHRLRFVTVHNPALRGSGWGLQWAIGT